MGRKKKPPVRGRRAFLKVVVSTSAVAYVGYMNSATALVDRLFGWSSALWQRVARPGGLVVPVGQVVETDVAQAVAVRMGEPLHLKEKLLVQVLRNGQVIETRER